MANAFGPGAVVQTAAGAENSSRAANALYHQTRQVQDRTHRGPILKCRVEDRELRLRGFVARTLYELVSAGERGVCIADVSSWAYWLPRYIHDLRHRHGLDIGSELTIRNGRRLRAYSLNVRVSILEYRGA